MGLQFVEIVMAVEQEYNVHLGDEELSNVRTVGEFEDFVARRVALTDPAAREHLHERLLDIMVQESGLQRSLLTPEADLYRDLRLGG